MKNKNLLYFTRTMGLGGTENVILQLCEIMKGEVSNIVVCSCGGINEKKLLEMGIKHINIPDIEKKDIKTFITVFRRLNKIIKEEKINIIHTHHRMAAFYTRILYIYKKFIFLNTQHNIFKDRKKLTKFSLKVAYNIAVGRGVEENLVNFYEIPKEKVKVIYNGIKGFDHKNFNEITEIKKYKKKGYFTVGNIGRITEQKGMEYFVKAIPRVLEKNNKVQFYIIGTGEDEDKIKNIAKKIGVLDKVVFLGYRDDIQNVMSNLDLIVLSSLWEGLPLTPIEAFSVSKAVIGTNINGTNELIQDGINGFLVETKNEQVLAEKIIELINDDSKRYYMQLNAYTMYKIKFSYERLKENYIECYKLLINKLV